MIVFRELLDACVATNLKQNYVLRKLQRGLNLIEAWCKRWDIKINEDNILAVCFSYRRIRMRSIFQ